MLAANADLRALCEEVRELDGHDDESVSTLEMYSSYRRVAHRLAVACEGLLGRVAEAEAAIWGLLCALGNHERAALDLMSMKWFAEAERDKALRRTREAEADADRYGERAERAEEEAERLRAVIETAPHEAWCASQMPGRLQGHCDCWKSRALVPAGESDA